MRLEATHPGAPPRAMALVDSPRPKNSRVFIRGNPNRLGEEAPRQFLAILAGDNGNHSPMAAADLSWPEPSPAARTPSRPG